MIFIENTCISLFRSSWYSRSSLQPGKIDSNKSVVSNSIYYHIIFRVYGAPFLQIQWGPCLVYFLVHTCFIMSWIVKSPEYVVWVISLFLCDRNTSIKFLNFWPYIVLIHIRDLITIKYWYLVGICFQHYFHMCLYSHGKGTWTLLCTCNRHCLWIPGVNLNQGYLTFRSSRPGLDWVCLTMTHVLQDIISRPTQVNVSQSCFNSLNKLLKLNYIVQVWGLVEVNCFISDRRFPLLAGIPLCMSRELSRKGYSMSQLCSIHHGIPVPLHTPGAYGQCWMFDHSGDKQSVVLGIRYGTWWPWYGQFEFGWLQPLQLCLNAGISLFAPMFHEVEISAMYSHIPLGLNQLLIVWVNQWIQICVVDTCQWVFLLVEGLFR